MRDASGRTAANLTAYLSAQLRANVYETLQKRLEKLCDLYRRFFNVLESSTEDLRRQIRELKTMGRQSSVGEQYICCSESCLETLYERFALYVSEYRRRASAGVGKNDSSKYLRREWSWN